MPTVYRRSRSPVRAINTSAHQAWASPSPHLRTWSEPEARELRAATPTPAPEHRDLACPDCGTSLRLALVPSRYDNSYATPHPHGDTPAALKAAPDVEPLPDFETSIQEHKRELIARALQESDGVMTRAAKALGLKYTTFVAMVHRLDVLDMESPRGVDGS